jgi:outer membrane protein assembly factor BamE (lipoprotein component of BamABCDE complex)
MAALTRALWIAGLCAALACATSGRRFDPDSVPRIRNGLTTQADVQRWFGAPGSIETRGSGLSRWRYQYEETTTRDTGMISRIGVFIARLFGARAVPSPVNVHYENRTRHLLTVYFDEAGVVRDYAYQRTDTPSKTIY